MLNEVAVDDRTGRKYYLDHPEDLGPDEPVTFVLNLHGGGSAGVWQRDYFPASDFVDAYRLVVATPTAKTAEPSRHWAAEADDEHLRNIVESVYARFGAERIRAFWLAGHSQGGMTSFRILNQPFFADRVDGFLSLSGGRIGRAASARTAGPPRAEGAQAPARPRREPPPLPDTDFSFIYTTGEHEIVALPETSPWAEKYGAGARERLADVVDEQAGKVWDTRREGNSNKGWGFKPRPGTAEVYVYPGARDGRVIADVVRLDKGHTEGLEPNVTEQLVKLMVSAPGGKAQRLASGAATTG